jgi:hypothetical protein
LELNNRYLLTQSDINTTTHPLVPALRGRGNSRRSRAIALLLLEFVLRPKPFILSVRIHQPKPNETNNLILFLKSYAVFLLQGEKRKAAGRTALRLLQSVFFRVKKERKQRSRPLRERLRLFIPNGKD